MAEADMSSPKDEVAAEEELAKETTPSPRVPYKSFRKKYRKMRVKFEDQMNEANILFKREHYTWDVAKRLREENDQLLDMITDLLLDRSRARSSNPVSDQSRITDRLHLTSMEKDLTWSALDTLDEGKLPYDLFEVDDGTLELDDPDRHLPPSYLTTSHEEKYLGDLDGSLSSTLPSTDHLPTNVETVNPEPPPRPRPSRLTEKDFRVKNPVSVGNWLQRHQPHVFEEQKEKDKDKDKDGEKGAEPSASTSKGKGAKKDKDKTLAKQDQPFEGLDDEIEFDPNYEPPTLGSRRGKRKRADDDTYRPKGGGRGNKRKRDKDDSEPKAKGGKKARTSIPGGHGDDATGGAGAGAA